MKIKIDVQLPINDDKDYQLVHDFDKDDFDNIQDFMLQIQNDAFDIDSGLTYEDFDLPGTGTLSSEDAVDVVDECIVYVDITHKEKRYVWSYQGCHRNGIDIAAMFRNAFDHLSSKKAFKQMVLDYNR